MTPINKMIKEINYSLQILPNGHNSLSVTPWSTTFHKKVIVT